VTRGLSRPERTRIALRGMWRTARGTLALMAAILLIWFGGLIWFAEQIPRAETAVIPDTPTDAVVVLTGGPLRLKTGLAELEARRARKLFVSGVYRGVEVAELLQAARQEPAAVECCIVLGYAADNTSGNAAETRAWMQREDFHSLRLVTASYHMRRSLLEFREAMPEIAITPHPVFPDGFRRDAWWAWPGTLSLIVTEYDKYLAAVTRLWLANGVFDDAPETM
jgi:uncharacterized SAM-binding protein YcdF (DUF218 family)